MVVAPVLQVLHAKDDFLNFGRFAWNEPPIGTCTFVDSCFAMPIVVGCLKLIFHSYFNFTQDLKVMANVHHIIFCLKMMYIINFCINKVLDNWCMKYE